MSQLEDLLQQCTVNLSLPDQRGWGTGFFVAPGLILTCAHVVKRTDGKAIQVMWQNRNLEAMVEQLLPDPYDLALLRVTLSANIHPPCVYLGEDVQSRDPLYLFGYPDEGDRQGEPRTFNCDGITGSAIASILFNLGQVRPGMSGSPLLNQRTGKICGIVKFTRDRASDLGGGAIPTHVILEQFPELRELQQAFHEKDRRWINLITPPGIDFQPYLQAILTNEDYREWQEVYTPTTVEDRQRMPEQETTIASQRRFSSRLKLRAEIVKPNKQEQGDQPDRVQEPQERVEQWDVLAGLRNYAGEHVVLSGKPGSGKSTSLERLLWEEAEKALQDPNTRIPVLVKLRRCTGTIEGLIRDFLVGHQVALEIAQIEELLRQGKFLLLLDGLNELPKAFETEVANFSDRYRRTTPMIVSTRELGEGGTLGIEKTLKMLPLTEPQMREFVRGYLGEEGDRLFQKLQGDRLRKFAETPLLLWMLCRVFAQNGKVPDNLGLAFREFTQLYDQDIPGNDPADPKDKWLKPLRHLAFVMMQGKTSIDPLLSIPREEAENCLTAYLQQEGRGNSRDFAERWLKDLLKYHLIQPVIQPNLEEHIEFRHQLIQEYYAAEYLLRLLQPPNGKPELTNEQLKRDYLNYLKWTEPISLMLALADGEAQALRMVKLAIDVDLMLGARLAGEVKPDFQVQTVKFVENLEVPDWLKVQLLGETRTESAITVLMKFLSNSDVSLRQRVVWALGETDSAQAVHLLTKLLDDPALSVRKKAITVLGEIGSAQAIDALIQVCQSGETALSGYAASILVEVLKNQNPIALNRIEKILVNLDVKKSASNKSLKPTLATIEFEDSITPLILALNDSNPDVRQVTAISLGKTDSEQAITPLIQALNDSNPDVRQSALSALTKISSEQAITPLIQALNDSNSDVRQVAAISLGKTGSEQAITPLIQALNDSNPDVRQSALSALTKISSEQAITPLIQALNDSNSDVRQVAAISLGKTGSEQAITPLIQALNDSNPNVRQLALSALTKISSEQAITPLIQALNDSNSDVRQVAAISLGKTGSEQAITPLIQALNDSNPNVRESALSALTKISSEQAITPLIQALNDSNASVRQVAAISLGKTGSEQAITPLIQALNDSNPNVRESALSALTKISSEQAITPLIQALNDSNPNVRQFALSALTKISSEQAITPLTLALNDSNLNVRQFALSALIKISSEQAITPLIQALNDSHPDVRRSIAKSLGKTGSEQAITPLIQALNDSNPNVRRSAAKSLGKTGSEQAITPLIQALNDSNPNVRESALSALTKISSEQAITPLIQALNDSNASVRHCAASSLGRTGSEQAITPLIQALNDSHPHVRQSALSALVAIGSEQVVISLAQVLEHSTSDMRENAAIALKNIGTEQAISVLMQSLTVTDFARRKEVAKVLLENRSEQFVLALKQALSRADSYVSESNSEPIQEISPKHFTPKLIKSLDHPNANEREQAAQALGKTRSNQAIDGLIHLINDPVSFVRGSAAQALGEIRSEQAINVLIQALSDPVSGVRWRVADALGNIASERAINPLVRALEDSDSVVRETVAESLGKIKGDKIAQQLPILLKMLPGKGGQEVMLAVAAIQNYCQFYNYKIWQTHLAAQQADRSKSQTSDLSSTAIYNIGQVGNLNTGTVNIHGDQIGGQNP